MHVDSVELLEVLLLFHADPSKPWNAQRVAAELRSNSNSTHQRILFLQALQLIHQTPEGSGEYVYQPQDMDMKETIDQLAVEYPLHRRSIFELIFSPMKRARDLADAFRRNGLPKESEEK